MNLQRWLTTLTLIGAFAVVAVIAVYLICIATTLIRANRNLTETAEALVAVRDNTVPLADDLPAINGAAVALRDTLLATDRHLQGIIRAVGRELASR
jgi:type VI protein secretion system component VasK